MGAIYKDGKFYNTGKFLITNNTSEGENLSKNYDKQIQELKKRIQILESTDFTSEDIN